MKRDFSGKTGEFGLCPKKSCCNGLLCHLPRDIGTREPGRAVLKAN